MADTDGKSVSIYNNEREDIPTGLTRFYYDDTKVIHVVFNREIDSYQAPFSSIKDDKGIWIPMEYSLLILNSSMLIVDDTVVIDIPTKSIVDTYLDIMKNNETYLFDWGRDFG